MALQQNSWNGTPLMRNINIDALMRNINIDAKYQFQSMQPTRQIVFVPTHLSSFLTSGEVEKPLFDDKGLEKTNCNSLLARRRTTKT